MLPSQSDFLISTPFGNRYEVNSSPRYYWDSSKRGQEPYVILEWTLGGEGVFEWKGKANPVPKDSAFIAIVPEATKYYYPKQGREPWEVAWLDFYGPFSISIFRQLREAFGPVLPLPTKSAAGVMLTKLIETVAPRSTLDPYESSTAAYAFIMEWQRQLTRPMLQAADPVQAALGLFSARFREPLGMKEVAAQMGLSREHFTRLFTERTGESPAEHLRSLRVAAAQQLMHRFPVPLKEVALRCGFPSVRALRRALDAA